MPPEQIRGMIASKFPEVVQQQSPKQPNEFRGTIVPYKQDLDTGEMSLAVPKIAEAIWDSAKSAVTGPGRAMSGELPMTGPDGRTSMEAIGEGFNAAAWMSPASPAAGLALTPAKGLTPKPEGLQAAEAAQRLGVNLPRAVTSESTAVQQMGKGLTNVPIGGTPLRRASETAIGQLDDAAKGVQQSFGSGSVEKAGSLAREGMTDFATNTLKGAVSKRYDAVDNLVAQNVVTPLSNTSKAAADILAKRGNAKIAGNSRAVELVRKAISEKDGLNYQGIKDLRTNIGELVDNPTLRPAGMAEGELKRIYGALSDDLRSAVGRSGGEKASKAFEEANSFAARAAKERQALDSIIGRQTSDEGIFAKVQAMAGSTSRADLQNLMRVKGSVGKDTWDEIASATLSRMGRDPDGKFSPDRFLTSYGKMSENGKKAMFGGNHAQAIDDIAAVSRRFKQMNQYANPSGTAQNVIGPAIGFSAISEPLTTLSSVAGARVASSILAKPMSADKVAKWAQAYEAAALKPSVKTTSMLTARARVLSLEVAKEMGAPNGARQIYESIARVGKAPAEPDQNNQLVPERQNNRPEDQLRALDLMPSNEI
jgi:hypothetical protein